MLTLSERGRHCRTCTALRRTRRWPAGLSCCVRGEGGAGGRHAATATSPPASGAGSLSLHCTSTCPGLRPHLALGRGSPAAAWNSGRDAAAARLTVRGPGAAASGTRARMRGRRAACTTLPPAVPAPVPPRPPRGCVTHSSPCFSSRIVLRCDYASKGQTEGTRRTPALADVTFPPANLILTTFTNLRVDI